LGAPDRIHKACRLLQPCEGSKPTARHQTPDLLPGAREGFMVEKEAKGLEEATIIATFERALAN
jgi:hypothetical protein